MTIQEKIEKARIAVEQISDYTQEQVDRLLYESAKVIYQNAEPLARLAVDETKLGRYQHKIEKNVDTAAVMYDYLKDKKSVGVINEIPELGITEVAHPVGVIASITPATNPTVTPLANFMQAIKGKNAMIVSPSPRAEKTTTETVNRIREAMAKAGAPEDLIQVVEGATLEKSRELMAACDLVVATGGPGLTKAAYSSGTPAYSVGPGNPPVIVDRDFDLDEAAEISVIAAGYDNGILCDGDNSMLYPQELEKDFFAALNKAGIVVFDQKADVDKFRELLFPGGVSNSELQGKDPFVIAKAAGFDVPEKTEVIGLKIEAIGTDEILTHEFLGPVVVLKSYEVFEEAVDAAIRILKESGGIGHCTGLFSKNQEHILYAGERLPVSRFMINQPSADGWGPPMNGLSPTMSEGCGTWGNNILAGNVDYIHMINVSKIVRPLDNTMPDADAMFKD